MRRRDFFRGIAGLATAWPFLARAQQATKRVPRLGALIGFAEHDPGTQRRVAAFKTGLAELGWVLDRNIAIEFRYGAGDAEKNRVLAAELVRLEPDVIFVNSTSATAAVLRQTSTIPVVFATVSDPVGSGFVTSLARPGGNVTGFWWGDKTLVGKRFGLLKEVVPEALRVAFLVRADDPTEVDELTEVPIAATALGLDVRIFEVRAAAEFEATFERLVREKIDGICVGTSPLFVSNRTDIVVLAARARLPSVSASASSPLREG